MRWTEAVQILNEAPRGRREFRVALACGFTPLHLQMFLNAELQAKFPDRSVSVTPGVFGDLAGTLECLEEKSFDAVAAALEWPDLDPRLGFREMGSWSEAALAEIVSGVPWILDRMESAIEQLRIPIALSMPTLPLPPLFALAGWQASAAELELSRLNADFAVRVTRYPHARVLSAPRLDEDSPRSVRHDLRSDLATGLPYSLPHAGVLAAQLARLIAPQAPRKGLITDLDDTLWHGIVGEIGIAGVRWDASYQLHALYQKLLGSLAEAGVLIAIASRNNPAVVTEALAREDLLLPRDAMYPIEVHWRSKSESVTRILQTWNVQADSVVFVDDSPMELAEVAAAHPGIECVQFPSRDSSSGLAMLRQVRDLFGKSCISEEDRLRAASLRTRAPATGATAEDFLAAAEAEISLDFGAAEDPRVLELVNKTNQFNLNGVRYAQAEWGRRLDAPGAFLAVVSYRDRFGPLGKIAILQGEVHDRCARLRTWAMSCRAFGRRIEHQCLKAVFERLGAETITFDFCATPKNTPLQECLQALLGAPAEPGCSLTQERFDAVCPALYHRVYETGSPSAGSGRVALSAERYF